MSDRSKTKQSSLINANTIFVGYQKSDEYVAPAPKPIQNRNQQDVTY